MAIDRRSPIPLYYQLREQLLGKIRSGEFAVGAQLPPEEDLVAQTGLSRFTVRQALQELEREGWIARIHGRGTFVSEPKIPLSVAWNMLGFTEDMTRKGHAVQSIVFRNELEPAPADAAHALGLGPADSVVAIERLRKVDGHPFLVDYIYVRQDLCRGLETMDLSNRSLFEVFEKHFGLTIAEGKRTLRIARADGRVAELLGVEVGAPLFLLTDIAITKSGQRVHCARTLINEERSEFEFDLFRGEAARQEGSVPVDAAAYPRVRRTEQ